MAASKTFQWFTWASGSPTASGTTDPMSCVADYVQEVYATIVQVGAASSPASFAVQWSPDGATYFAGESYAAPLADSTSSWIVSVPGTAEDVRIVYTAQSGGTSSTITAQLGQVIGI